MTNNIWEKGAMKALNDQINLSKKQKSRYAINHIQFTNIKQNYKQKEDDDFINVLPVPNQNNWNVLINEIF